MNKTYRNVIVIKVKYKIFNLVKFIPVFFFFFFFFVLFCFVLFFCFCFFCFLLISWLWKISAAPPIFISMCMTQNMMVRERCKFPPPPKKKNYQNWMWNYPLKSASFGYQNDQNPKASGVSRLCSLNPCQAPRTCRADSWTIHLSGDMRATGPFNFQSLTHATIHTLK